MWLSGEGRTHIVHPFLFKKISHLVNAGHIIGLVRKDRTGVFVTVIVGVNHFTFLSELSREIILRVSTSPSVSDCDVCWWTFDGFGLLLMLLWKMKRISKIMSCCGRSTGPVLGGTMCFEGNRGCARCWWQSSLHQSRKDCITATEEAETGIQFHQRFSWRGHPAISTSMTTQTGSFLFPFPFLFPNLL